VIRNVQFEGSTNFPALGVAGARSDGGGSGLPRKLSASERDRAAKAKIHTIRANNDSTSRIGNVINVAGVVGVILPKNARVLRNLYPAGNGYWTPSVRDVLEAEARLELFLKASKQPQIPEILKGIRSYKRQYRGLEGGQKFLVVRFFCDTPLPDLTEQELVILDGGSCFFNVRYSISTKTFSSLEINGYA
jgi:hypothetical protein